MKCNNDSIWNAPQYHNNARLYRNLSTPRHYSSTGHAPSPRTQLHRMHRTNVCRYVVSSANDEVFRMICKCSEQSFVVEGTPGATVVYLVALQRCHVPTNCTQDGIPSTDVPLLDECRVHVRIHAALHHLKGFVACKHNRMNFFNWVNDSTTSVKTWREISNRIENMMCKFFDRTV